MRLTTIVAAGVIALSATFMSAHANECTSYDREVSELVRQLDEFKTSLTFREYGLGAGGPYAEWFKRVEKVRDNREGAKRLWLIGDGDGTVETLVQVAMMYMRGRAEAWLLRDFKSLKNALSHCT